MLTHSTMALFGMMKNHFKLEKKTEIHCQGYRKHGKEILYSFLDWLFFLSLHITYSKNVVWINKNMFLHFPGKLSGLKNYIERKKNDFLWKQETYSDEPDKVMEI